MTIRSRLTPTTLSYPGGCLDQRGKGRNGWGGWEAGSSIQLPFDCMRKPQSLLLLKWHIPTKESLCPSQSIILLCCRKWNHDNDHTLNQVTWNCKNTSYIWPKCTSLVFFHDTLSTTQRLHWMLGSKVFRANCTKRLVTGNLFLLVTDSHNV